MTQIGRVHTRVHSESIHTMHRRSWKHCETAGSWRTTKILIKTIAVRRDLPRKQQEDWKHNYAREKLSKITTSQDSKRKLIVNETSFESQTQAAKQHKTGDSSITEQDWLQGTIKRSIIKYLHITRQQHYGSDILNINSLRYTNL